MRAKDAVGKYRQKVACVQVRGQGWTVPAAGQRRGLKGGLDIVAAMLPAACVPLVARLGAVV